MSVFSVRSINTVTALIVSALLLIGVAGLVAYVSTSSYNIIFNLSGGSMETIDKNVVTSINDMIDSNLSLIKVPTLNPDVRKAVRGEDNSADDYIKSLFSVYKGLNSIYIFDLKGVSVAGFTKNGDRLRGVSYIDRAYVKETLSGKESIQAELVQAKTTGGMVFVMAVPVLDENGKVIGGAAVTIDWSAFVQQHILPVKFGENGYAFVLDAKGRVIAHPDKDILLKDMSGLEFVKDSQAKKEGMSRYVYKGKEKVQAFSQVKRTGWTVYIGADEQDLTAAAISQRNILIVSGSVTFLVLLSIIVVILRRLVITPLRNIMEYSAKIAGGDFKAVLQGRFRYELAELAQNFQETTAVLKNRLGFADGVLQGITFPVVITDTDTKVVYTNEAMLKMIGLPGVPADYAGQTAAQFFYGDPSRKTINHTCLEEKRNALGIETEMSFRDGKKHYLRIDASLIHDLDGAIVGAITLVADLTEIKQQQKLIEAQNDAVSGVARSADVISDRLSTATEELSAQIEQSSRGAEIQSQRVSETATAMDQMNASVLEVAKNAAGAAQTSGNAKNKAESGADMVNHVVRGIAQLHQQAMNLKGDMATLGVQAQNIGQIMNVISDIADQTNLLALNAAIEAARAGEAGRGFAVVADEVRKLAEKTMNATKEVGDAIQGIQNGTSKNVAHVEQTVATIEETTILANQSGEALTEIVSLVEQAADQARSIATASEEQSATSEEVNRSVDEINHISAETSEAMLQSAKAVAELAQQAQELKTLISQMHSDEEAPPRPAISNRPAALRALAA